MARELEQIGTTRNIYARLSLIARRDRATDSSGAAKKPAVSVDHQPNVLPNDVRGTNKRVRLNAMCIDTR